MLANLKRGSFVLISLLFLVVNNRSVTTQTATSLSNLAASMQPGTWATLTTTGIGTALSSADTGGGAEGNILVYSDDAVWDPVSRRVLFIGGDHNWSVSFTTKFVSYSDATNSWQKFPTPPWASGVTHGYHHTAIDRAAGMLYHRPYNKGQVQRFNLATQQWDQPPALSVAVNCCDAIEYFPELGGLVWVNGNSNVYLYRPSTNQWSTLASNLAMGGTWHTASYNPVHKVLIFYSDSTNALYKLSSTGQITRLANPPVSIYDGSGYSGVLTVDPVSGKYLLLSSTVHDLYSYDVLTDTWAPQSSSGKPNLSSQAVVAASLNTYGVVFFAACRAGNCAAYLYKHAAGTAPSPPPPPPPSDTTAPTVSIAAPASGATVSGTVPVSGSASDNAAVASVQVQVDSGSFAAANGTTSWSYSLNTGTLSNGSHTIRARAVDTSGNMSAVPSVTVNVNNAAPPPPPPTSDFQTLCGQAGVLKCVSFDSTADIAGTWGDNSGILAGDARPEIDTTVKSSGTGSLKFTVPSNSGANSSGSYFTNFSGNLSTQFGANSEFYVQWRQRFSPEFLTTKYSGGGGWKQAILGTGDKPGCSSSSSGNCSTSCTDLETVTQNNYYRGLAQMYNSCSGSTSHGPYDPFQQPFGSSDFKLQNAPPSPYCLYSQGSSGYFPPNGNCIGYFANEWMTFQVHIKTGPRVNDEFTNSFVQLWIAREGQSAKMAFDWGPYNLSAGPAAEDQKFGKIWLLPYNTGKSSSVSYPVAYTWYDELIISSQPIPMSGGSSDTSAPTVSISAPGNGATVSGTTTVSANASDNVGVAGVQFKLDGANLGAEDTTSPYSVSWTTTTASNGSHTITAVARDAVGNTTTSAAVTVTVSNTADVTAPSVPAGLTASVISSAQVNLSWTSSTDNLGVTGYRVERCLGSACSTFTQIAAPSGTPYSDTGLAASSTYRYRVRAADAAGNLSGYSSIVNATTPAASAGLYGLEWPGDGATRRMLKWTNPFPIYDATYIFKVYPRKKTTGTYKYYTTFFWGNNGTFVWDGGRANTYYGAHPYPIPAPSGPGQWEISVWSNDYVTGSEVQWDRWYTQAFRAWRESPSITHHEFYYDLPDTSKVITRTIVDSTWATQNPPSPAIVVGQAPNLNGASWGGYPGWEEFNGMIRGIQMYSGLLSVADIQAEITAPKSTTAGQNFMWYLNVDPRPGDVADKKGFGVAHNPTWEGTTAFEWASQPSPDTTPPSVSITAPAGGATVSGTITVSATASDNVGVAGVQFKLDGTNLGGEDTASPYSASWNTLASSNGSHTLTAVARDAAGNSATSVAITVTVTNATSGRTIHINPGTNVFSAAAQGLLSGDTLIVHQGTYSETNRMSIQVQGTASAPITITGAAGETRPIITRPASASLQNTINIEGSAAYLTLRGLEIVGNGGDGINMNGTHSNITLEDLVIHDIDVGVNFRNSMNNITVRKNHIYNLGIGGGTGEGMYVGCNDATCVVRNSLIEQNWIHDSLPGTTQGDGIEVKVGSHSNVVRDNVIYNMSYPGIFVYGTGSNPVNIVEGNVIWNVLEGIYAVADAIVRNNIVFNSGTGLSLYSHSQVAQMKNVTAVNNTLYNNSEGVYLRWGTGATNMILANNAVYSPGKTALSLGGSSGTFARNYVEGATDRTLDGTAFINGGTSANAFVNAAAMDFWLRTSSILIGTANATYAPTLDFNGTTRTGVDDAGAYETNGAASNPGWRITAGFKNSSAPPPAPPPPPDTTAPIVSITSPAADANVSGTITVTATASDNVGVIGVQFKLDGANLGAEDTNSPYSVSWNTAAVSTGWHTLTVVARDAAGNTTTSAGIRVRVRRR